MSISISYFKWTRTKWFLEICGLHVLRLCASLSYAYNFSVSPQFNCVHDFEKKFTFEVAL